MRYRPWRPMPAPTRRGPASPMRRFLAKPRIPLRSRCALRSMPPYGSASLRAPLTAAPAGSTAPHGSPLSGRPLSRRRGTRARAKPLAASLRARVPLALTIPRARGADDLASRTWNARFTFVRTKPLRDVARTNHLAPAGVLADYRATRRVGSAAPFSPMRFGERNGLEGWIPQGLRFAAVVNLFWARRVVRRAPFVAIPSMGLLRRLRGHHAALVIGLASRGNSMLAPTPFRCL